MSNDNEMPSDQGEPLPTLARLTEIMTRRLQSGEQVDAEEFVERYPDRSRSIRVLLPTLFELVELSRALPRKPPDRRTVIHEGC